MRSTVDHRPGLELSPGEPGDDESDGADERHSQQPFGGTRRTGLVCTGPRMGRIVITHISAELAVPVHKLTTLPQTTGPCCLKHIGETWDPELMK